MRQLFISDLHLWEQEPRLEKLFLQFMLQQASAADELYVLGDLFEAWIGDDAVDALAETVINAFSHYSNTGGKLYFLHGNRDFLLGDDFAVATGGTILKQPHSMNLAGQSALLLHGDALCTQDVDYMAFRNQVRSAEWQQDFLTKSIAERQQIAREIRGESSARGKMLDTTISDVTESEVINLMQQYSVTLLLHGHTHRQARHPLTINGQSAERIVLGDWGATGSVLMAENNQLDLVNFT